MKCTDKNCYYSKINHVCFKNSKGQFHREDGPAVIFAEGMQFWFQNGQLHREDGPALIRADGYQGWYIHGKLVR